MTMITPSYLGETIEYSSLHACRSTLEDPTGLLWQRDGDVRRAAETHHDAADEEAGGLVGDAVFEEGLSGVAKLAEIAVEQHSELGRNSDDAGGGGELVEDVLQAAAVVGKDEGARHGESFAGDLGSDEGIAVAVAADPGAEAYELRELGESGFDAVLIGEGAGYFGVEDRQGVEDGGLVVVEGHADFVAHRGAGLADFVGLPEGGDLGDDVLLKGFELGVGDGDAVELLEEIGDAAALEHDDAAGDFGGVRGKDGRDADALEQGAGVGGGDSGLLHLPEGSAE